MMASWSLKRRLLVTGFAVVLVPLALCAGLTWYQGQRMSQTALTQAERLADKDLEHIVQGVRAMCETQQEMLKRSLAPAVTAARAVLEEAGPVSFATESETWTAVNQFDQAKVSVVLPKMTVGGVWLGHIVEPKTRAPLVDKVTVLNGAACTVFQRLNEAGDLLRVCTSVLNKEGQRAIGTYIPAVQPDGKQNPVVAKMLAGERYEGKAFVVSEWYLTAYEPLKDASGRLIGALFVGVPQRSAAALRQALLDTKVGSTGYVFVVQGSGAARGTYLVSDGGKQDGECVWDATDSLGGKPVQTIIGQALALKDRQTARHRYLWRGSRQAEQWRVTRVAYFEPWDWVIGAAVPEDELLAANVEIRGTARTVTGLAGVVLVGSVLLAGAIWVAVASRLSGQIGEFAEVLDDASREVAAGSAQVAGASTDMAQGASRQASAIQDANAHIRAVGETADANAGHAAEANQVTQAAAATTARAQTVMATLDEVMARIKASSDETQKINSTVNAISFQTNLLALNAAVEAARAGAAGAGFAVVAGEVRELSLRSAEAAHQTSDLLSEVQHNAAEGVATAQQAADLLAAIAQAVSTSSERIAAVSAASAEQTAGIAAVLQAMAQADQATQSTAAAAEESAAASEELSGQAQALAALVRDLMRLAGSATDGAAEERPVVSEPPVAEPSLVAVGR